MKNLMGKVNSKMRENKRNGRRALKGFTLVEIIVVLVILAILAAAMIPALTGYIDKAKNKTMVAEARNAVTAAQTLASEAYGLGKNVQCSTVTSAYSDSNKTGYHSGYSYSSMETLAEVATGSITKVEFGDKNKVSVLWYEKNGLRVVYHGGTFDDPVEAS